MKLLSAIVFSVLITTVVLDESTTHHSSSTKEAPTTMPHSSSSGSDTTTDKPTTTPKSTTPKPTAPTPTTHEPTTTSSEPPTTTPTPTPTTHSSTTTLKPTPEPKPSSAPTVVYNITEDGETCIRVSMQLYFEISIENKTEFITVDQNASSDGSSCKFSNGEEILILTVPDHYVFSMIFVNESGKVYVNETTLRYQLPEGKGIGSSDQKLFSVTAGHSYLCKSQTQVKMESVTMHLAEVHVQAFGKPGNDNFGDAQECDLDDKVSDAIPIAVGVALAALIIIVLIAYLVGRRQSRQRGYQSV